MNTISIKTWALVAPPLIFLMTVISGVVLELFGYSFLSQIQVVGKVAMATSIVIFPFAICRNLKANKHLLKCGCLLCYLLALVIYVFYWALIFTLVIVGYLHSF